MARTLASTMAAGVALVLASSAAQAAAPPAKDTVAIELSADRTSLATTDDVVVRFSIRNLGGQRSINKWETPLVEVESDLFKVERDGVEVAYLGIIAKRDTPVADDFIRLAPRQTLSAKVELSSLYDMSQPGNYTVSFRAALANLDPASGAAQGRVVSSNGLSLELRGEPVPSRVPEAPAPAAASVSYNKCTNSQIATLQQAVPAAASYASAASSSLTGTAGARYTTWFGTYDSGRYNTVKNHFTAISSAFNNAAITVDCGCKKQYYAYVYPTQPYKIYVCRAFWNAPLTGTDSKAGTLVHEMSHFNVVSGTDDWAYGQSACKSLAISDPSKAVDNADSHEYYAENTPAQ